MIRLISAIYPSHVAPKFGRTFLKDCSSGITLVGRILVRLDGTSEDRLGISVGVLNRSKGGSMAWQALSLWAR